METNYKKIRVLLSSLICVSIFSINALAQESSGAKPAELPPPATLEELQQRITKIITQPKYAAAMWGIKVVSLDSGKVWFTSNPEKLFSPASNSKLYTMAMALDTLGPDYRIKTSLYAESRPDASGTLAGDLIIYGRGDPSISSEFGASNSLKALEPLLAALTNAGVRKIEGDIVGDESFLHGEPFGSGWTCDDLENYYGAEISALTLDANVASLVIKPGDSVGTPGKLGFDPPTDYIEVANHTTTAAKGTRKHISIHHSLAQNSILVSGEIPLEDKESKEDVTIHNPAGYFASIFRNVLTNHGIEVKGNSRSVDWLERSQTPGFKSKWIELGSIQSQPFSAIIRSVQKPSQNLYTDLILEHIGARKAQPQEGMESERSESLGLAELNRFLKKAGVKPMDTLFQDGSGLARDNLTTPNATAALLTFMSHHKDSKVYLEALPIAGVDGTLRNRFKGTPVEGNLRGKTGTLHFANSLSGYMTNAAGEHLIITIMLNRYQPSSSDGPKTRDMDEIAVMLAKTKFDHRH